MPTLEERKAHRRKRAQDRAEPPTKDEAASHYGTCQGCEKFDHRRVRCSGLKGCKQKNPDTHGGRLAGFVLPRARVDCPDRKWRWGKDCTEPTDVKRDDMRAAGLGDGRRLLIFHRAGYRWAELNKNYGHLARDGWNTRWVKTDNYAPPADEVRALVEEFKPIAVIRWEEHGTLFVNRTWRGSLDYLYSVGVIPLSMDCGYFDHWRTQMIDQYMPDGSSSIRRDWPHLPTDIDWTRFDPRVRAYRKRVLDDQAAVASARPLLEPGYVALWVQFSAWLSRKNMRPQRSNVTAWAKKAIEVLKAAGHQVVVKAPPVRLGCNDDPKDWEEKDRVFVFKHNERKHMNAHIHHGAAWSVAISSSVSNENTILWTPMSMTGRSFFSRMGVFDEPEDWSGITKPPVVDPIARAKWVNWWAEHQFYAENVSPVVDRLIGYAQERGDGS